MKKIIALFLALVVLSIQGNAQIDTSAIDKIVQASAATERFEGTVLIAEKGELVYQKSFGFKGASQENPVMNDTRFSIASITKMFTSIIIQQLVEEGKISLEDDLRTLLPTINIRNSKKITVHHLLLHISGLPNEDDEIYQQLKLPKEYIVETLDNKKNSFGEFNYANIDYVLLGLIIEKMDGISWKQSVQERILDKLEMKETGFLAKNKYPNNFAYSFSFNEKGERESDPLFFIENFNAAACMFSTAQDLLKLDQAMYTEVLLTDESKKQMYTSYPEYNYSGYGVWTYNYPFAQSKPIVMERRGGIMGANSVLIRLLDTNKTIIVLSNNNKFNPDSFGNVKSLKEALMIEVDRMND